MFKNKTIFLLIMSLLFSLGLTGCKKESYYLSYIQTQTDNQEEAIYVFSLDLETKENKEIATLPFQCSYACTLYDKKNNCIYYSNNNESKDHSDWVLKYDCKTQKSEVLINSFLRINDILLTNDNKICVIANTKDDNTIKPYIYDSVHSKLTKIDLNGDMCFGSYYNCIDDVFLFTGYDDNKSRTLMEKYNNADESNIKESDYNIDNHIYRYKDDIGKVINEKSETMNIDSSINGFIQLMDDNNLLCIASTISSEGIYNYNIKENKFDKEYYNSEYIISSAHLIKNK